MQIICHAKAIFYVYKRKRLYISKRMQLFSVRTPSPAVVYRSSKTDSRIYDDHNVVYLWTKGVNVLDIV